jgi:septum formation protein
MDIILASASPRRAELFRQMNLTFITDPSDVDEDGFGDLDPEMLVKQLSSLKGEDVAKRHKDALVIAADTIVCLDDQILGKPASEEEASEMLNRLSGQTHEVYSGVWVGNTDANANIIFSFSFSERTKVTFSALSQGEIDYYVAGGSPMDKAGAYGIQDDFGALFVEKIEGDYYNVVGFPMNAFYQNLRTLMPGIHQTIFFGTDA